MRTVVAVFLAIVAAFLLALAALPALDALHARHAVVSNCADSLHSLPRGAWVRLDGCRVDMFHASVLDDAHEIRSHRVVPVRPPWESAAEPARLALAIPLSTAPGSDAFRTTARPDSAASNVADLDQTTGIILGPLDSLPHRLAEVPGFDHGLASRPLIIEVRAVPPLSSVTVPLTAAAAAFVLSVVLFVFRRPTRARGVDLAEPPRVRWGLVFLGVLVGLAAMWRGAGWYFGPGNPDRPFATLSAAPTAPTTEPAGGALPTATREEIALLASKAAANRLKGADTLLGRAVTADVIAAVDAALQQNPSPELESRLVCLKSRSRSTETLAFLLARFPRDRDELGWNLKPDVACMLDALVARIEEAPEQIRDTLMPAVYATNGVTREKTLRAFRLINLPQLPALLVAEASVPGPLQREALAAALALGAMRHHRSVVENALTDPHLFPIVKQELRTDPHPNAARMLARAWVDGFATGELELVAKERESHLHDVSAALLEIVVRGTDEGWKRVAAARHLERLGEVGALYDLDAFTSTLEPGEMKSVVEATIAVLRARQRGGIRPAMRSLPQ